MITILLLKVLSVGLPSIHHHYSKAKWSLADRIQVNLPKIQKLLLHVELGIAHTDGTLLTNQGPSYKNQSPTYQEQSFYFVSRFFYLLHTPASTFLFFLLPFLFADSFHLCFSICAYVGSLTSKLPSTKLFRKARTQSGFAW